MDYNKGKGLHSMSFNKKQENDMSETITSRNYAGEFNNLFTSDGHINC